MSTIFTNGDQLKEWLEAAEGIERRFGIEKALGYVIGEKFYKLAASTYESRRSIRTIADNGRRLGTISCVKGSMGIVSMQRTWMRPTSREKKQSLRLR